MSTPVDSTTKSTPTALMATGTAMQMFGTLQANYDKSAAESQNANYYFQEASYARQAADRQAQLSAQKYTYQISLQGSAAAKGGVDQSGSIANDMADTLSNSVQELLAIKRRGDMDVELAQQRGERAKQQSDIEGSDGYNALQLGKTALTAAALF